MEQAQQPRTPAEIFAEVQRDWKKPYYGAKPYMEALAQLGSWDSAYYADEARGLGLYFLANAGTWRGEVARRVKAEIKAACEQGGRP